MTYDGRPILIARTAVERYMPMYNLTERAVRHGVARSGVPPITDPHPPIHARIPAYDQAAMDAYFAQRRGKAWRRKAADD